MRTRNTLVALAATAALTAGCGSVHPGAAVRVGDESVSMAEVDRLTADYCSARTDSFKASSLVAPMSLLRSSVVQAQVVRAIGDQMADEYDLEAGSNYSRQVSALRARGGTLPEEDLDAMIEVEGAFAYLEDIGTQAAEIELERAGVTEPSREDVQAKARDMFAHWGDDEGIEIDPRFDLEFTDGTFRPAGGADSVSVPVSDVATGSQIVEQYLTAPQVEQQALQEKLVDYARSLPADQRCG